MELVEKMKTSVVLNNIVPTRRKEPAIKHERSQWKAGYPLVGHLRIAFSQRDNI